MTTSGSGQDTIEFQRAEQWGFRGSEPESGTATGKNRKSEPENVMMTGKGIRGQNERLRAR